MKLTASSGFQPGFLGGSFNPPTTLPSPEHRAQPPLLCHGGCSPALLLQPSLTPKLPGLLLKPGAQSWDHSLGDVESLGVQRMLTRIQGSAEHSWQGQGWRG